MVNVLCIIEVCINSRPLTHLSTNPNDLRTHTSFHFIIGARLLTLHQHSFDTKIFFVYFPGEDSFDMPETNFCGDATNPKSKAEHFQKMENVRNSSGTKPTRFIKGSFIYSFTVEN